VSGWQSIPQAGPPSHADRRAKGINTLHTSSTIFGWPGLSCPQGVCNVTGV